MAGFCLGRAGDMGGLKLKRKHERRNHCCVGRGCRINDLRGAVAQLRERMTHLEGLLEGLREAISGRAAS